MNPEVIYVFLIFIILLLLAIYFGRHKAHPPIVDFPVKGKGIAYVHLYFGTTRFNSDPYRKYKFIRNDKGKWKYAFENKKKITIVSVILYLLCAVPAVFMPLLEKNKEMLLFSISFLVPATLVYALFIMGGYYLFTLEPYIILMLYFRKRKAKKVETEAQNVYKYAAIEKKIKLFIKAGVFLIWLVGLGLFGFILVFTFISLVVTVGAWDFLRSAVILAILIGLTMITCSWVRFLDVLMGDYSCSVSVSDEKDCKKYAPKKILAKLKNNRRNVIYLKNDQWQVQIYGAGETHVLEIKIENNNDFQVFHMIDYDQGADETAIMPVADETTTIIENRWHERFPVRKCWLVKETEICSFLQRLYECKYLQAVLKEFAFSENTGEVQKLIAADVYIIPEVPVDWPVGGLQSNMGAEWMRKKEERVQRALDILNKK